MPRRLCLTATAVSFRPLIRGFFFYKNWDYVNVPKGWLVSVPSFGDSFFMHHIYRWNSYSSKWVSVPSFGDSFFMTQAKSCNDLCNRGFPSPHSGILFLFAQCDCLYAIFQFLFPSPHSGILFLLSASMKRIILMIWRFRPLIRGFFFMVTWGQNISFA